MTLLATERHHREKSAQNTAVDAIQYQEIIPKEIHVKSHLSCSREIEMSPRIHPDLPAAPATHDPLQLPALPSPHRERVSAKVKTHQV